MSATDRIFELGGEILPDVLELTYGRKFPQFVGKYLVPRAPVKKAEGKIPKHGVEAFKRYKTSRGLGADSNTLPVDKRTRVPYDSEEHDAEFPIDYQESDAADYDLESHGAFRAKMAVELDHEAEIAEMAQDLDNYPGDNKVTLLGEDKLSDYEHSDPEGVSDDAKEQIRKMLGTEPNLLLIAHDAFVVVKKHPAVKAMLSSTERQVIKVDHLKEFFDVPNIAIGKSFYMVDLGTDESKFSDLWTDCMIFAYVPGLDGPPGQEYEYSVQEPAWAYTLVPPGYPMVYKWNKNPKVVRMNYTDKWGTKIVGTGAAYIVKGIV